MLTLNTTVTQMSISSQGILEIFKSRLDDFLENKEIS